MVLDYVTNRADTLVESAARGDVEVLGHRDLDLVHVLAVPDRFQERVREAEKEDVLDRRLAQVVVDAETALLGEHPVQRLVQRPGRLQIAPKRLLDDDAPTLRKSHVAELVDDRREELRRDCEIVDRAVAPPSASRNAT